MPQTSSRRTLATALLLVVSGISLQGCAGKAQVRSLDGAAKAFDAPKCVVQGKTRYDQNWIDGQIEGGVGAFNWKRPTADRTKCGVVETQPAKIAPAKKKHWWNRA